MASSIQIKSSTNSAEIARICIECQIPSDCHLEPLDSKYLGWEKNPNILPADSIVISELHLQNLRLPLHPLYHYIFAIHDIHPLQITVNSIRTISGFLLLSLIKNLGLGVEDFHYCFSRVRYGNTHRYYFTPKKGRVWFTGFSSKVPDRKRRFLLSGNWQSQVVSRNIFEIRRDFHMAEEGAELYNPKTPTLPKERVRYLRKFMVKDKNSGLDISLVVNSTSLDILARCSPFFVMNCVGNPLSFLKDHQKLMSTFPTEVARFSQVCSYRRGLFPTPDETDQLTVSRIPEEEFDKASDIIGSFRFSSSTDSVSLEVETEEGNESAPSDALVKRKFTSKDPPEYQPYPSKKKKSKGLMKIPVPGLILLKSMGLSGSKGKPEHKLPGETYSEKQKSSEPKIGPADPLKCPSEAIITSQKHIGTSTVNFKPPTLQLGSLPAPISPTLQLGSLPAPISPTLQLGSSSAPIFPTLQLGSSPAPISAPKTSPEYRAFAEPSSVKEKKSFSGTSFSENMAPEDFHGFPSNFDTCINTISAGNFTKGVTTLFQRKCESDLLDATKRFLLVSNNLIDQLLERREAEKKELVRRLQEAEKKELVQCRMIENLEASLNKEKNQVIQFSEENQQLLAREEDFLAKIVSLENDSKVADRDKTLLQNKIADLERWIFSAKEKEREATAQTRAKFTEVLKQYHAGFSRMGVVNNCCGFRLGWSMALSPPEERKVADPDTYDLKNKITVNNYEESHYIDHEGLQIHFTEEKEDAEGLSSESEEEPTHEAEEAMPDALSETADNPAKFSPAIMEPSNCSSLKNFSNSQFTFDGVDEQIQTFYHSFLVCGDCPETSLSL